MKKTKSKSKSLPARQTAATAPNNSTRVVEVEFRGLTKEEYLAFGIKSQVVVRDLVIDSGRLQIHHNKADMDNKNHDQIRDRAFTALEEMKPNGITQSMLAVQMVGVHNAAVDFLSRSSTNGDSDIVDRNVLRATRLMRLFV